MIESARADRGIDLTKCAPDYLDLYEKGVLAHRAFSLDAMLSCCTLCPRRCQVNRKADQLGACRVNAGPRVAAMSVHPWEEPPISGYGGSGTIFFSGCTLKCVFCQNYPVSQMGVGRTMTVEELAEGMLRLQGQGAHNINLVTATHQMPFVAQALLMAIPQGFHLPLVYNTSGYESIETLRLLHGIVDIYLPDIKYSDSEVARQVSGRVDYVDRNRSALMEMWRQVGPLRMDANGVAVRGLLIRHLVLPGGLAGSEGSFEFLAEKIGREVWISVMNQYFPAHLAHGMPPLDRKVTEEEYEHAFALLERFDLENGYIQCCSDDDPWGAG